ncbi:hypothetical protein BC830DRAFT_167842 [Chytriomyces sp. MP71]|nr:hypothetical protein BC830DRAFT_167842 [Chytriomyces sp. MP71]
MELDNFGLSLNKTSFQMSCAAFFSVFRNIRQDSCAYEIASKSVLAEAFQEHSNHARNRHERRRWMCFSLLLAAIALPSVCLSISFVHWILPSSGVSARVAVLSGSQQLVKLPAQFVHSAFFNASRFQRFSGTLAPRVWSHYPSTPTRSMNASVFDHIPALSESLDSTLMETDFGSVSLERIFPASNLSQLHSAFIFHILESGTLDINVSLPDDVPYPHQNVSLSVVIVPEVTSATQNIYPWPETTEEYLPIHIENIYLEHHSTHATFTLATKATGHYIISFTRTIYNSSRHRAVKVGSISINASTPVYQLNSTSNCNPPQEVCALVLDTAKQSSVFYVLFETAAPRSPRSHFLNMSEIMHAPASVGADSWFSFRDLHRRVLESSGFVVAEYTVTLWSGMYLPLLVVVSFMWTATLFAVWGRFLDVILRFVWRNDEEDGRDVKYQPVG